MSNLKIKLIHRGQKTLEYPGNSIEALSYRWTCYKRWKMIFFSQLALLDDFSFLWKKCAKKLHNKAGSIFNSPIDPWIYFSVGWDPWENNIIILLVFPYIFFKKTYSNVHHWPYKIVNLFSRLWSIFANGAHYS